MPKGLSGLGLFMNSRKNQRTLESEAFYMLTTHRFNISLQVFCRKVVMSNKTGLFKFEAQEINFLKAQFSILCTSEEYIEYFFYLDHNSAQFVSKP